MTTKIIGEQPFQVLTNNFSISPSNEGYTLQISADGINYSNLFTVGAGVTRLVTGVAANSYYKLSGNQSNVVINWMKTCVTGGGGNGTELEPIADFPLNAVEGTVVSYTGSSSASGVYQYDGTDWVAVGGGADLSNYWTSAETESAISAATIGKADASTLLEPNSGHLRFPFWNEQGIITGPDSSGTEFYKKNGYINGEGYVYLNQSRVAGDFHIYAPVSAGTAGEVLVSTGNGAPVWSAVTGGGGSTEEIELPIAAAINEVKSDLNVRLSQKYFTKQDILTILDGYATLAALGSYTTTAELATLLNNITNDIENKELAISAAINDINTRISE